MNTGRSVPPRDDEGACARRPDVAETDLPDHADDEEYWTAQRCSAARPAPMPDPSGRGDAPDGVGGR